MSNTIHPTAIVSDQAQLGENNIIGPHAVIEANVQMGNGNTLMTGVSLKNGVKIGDDNTLHEYAVIGGLPQDLGFDPAIISYVTIGNGNTLREYVTVHRASKQDAITQLGDENYLMTHVHLGHDCLLGNRVIIAPSTGLGGFVHVADRAFISGGVMVHQFVQIGTLAMIGGNAKITQDVLPYMITDGVPSTVRGLNLVGLRRAGCSRSDIQLLKQAYQIIHRSAQPQQVILEELREMDSPYTIHLAEFITGSRRGFHREK
ncbi:MAG: acyl-ACP--UDP-N-acetylglucosamine O-acyltransferase [Gammaproteobacteria bacterium]|nr:acyl-ACP--UDP-N-acetylglucosamine O-acyltransferase [Gammaproteobacteria bacterium]